LIGPLSHKAILETIQAFVDDSSIFLIVTDENGTTAEELLTHNTQLWERLLHASGGKLELSKCKFTVMQWDFDPAGRPLLQVKIPKYTTLQSPTAKITKQPTSNTSHPILHTNF
jgi:hypothetical protein